MANILQTQSPLEDALSMVAPEAGIEFRESNEEREYGNCGLPPEPQPDIDDGNSQQTAKSLISM